MIRFKGWLTKVWRKILLFFSAGVLVCALVAVPCFADTASYANGEPFVSGQYFQNVTCRPTMDNLKYSWTSNDTTRGTGTYAYSTVQNLNSSFPLLAGDYWKYTHSFADNHGYQISGTLRCPYNDLPYRDDVISYYIKFAMGFSTMSNIGSGWLNATLRFYNSSDVRLGEVYTMTKFASLASFAIQTQVPAFSSPVSYMTLQFSGTGSSGNELYINEVYFSALQWTIYADSPVTIDYESFPNPTPPPDFNNAVDYLNDIQASAAPVDADIQSIIADAATIETSINNTTLTTLAPSLLAFKFQFDNWWIRCDPALRNLIFFFVGASCLTSLAGLTVSIVNKSKGG